MNGDLENQFKEDLLEAVKQCREKLHYNPTYFLQMLYELNAVETARHLVNSPTPAEGFSRLWEGGCLSLSVEAHVIKERYHTLFEPEEIERARKRLEEYRYNPNL